MADAARSTTVVAREIIWKSPKKFANVLNYKYLLLTRMGEALFPYIRLKGVEAFLHGIGRPIRNSMVGSVQAITTRQLGLKKLGLVIDLDIQLDVAALSPAWNGNDFGVEPSFELVVLP